MESGSNHAGFIPPERVLPASLTGSVTPAYVDYWGDRMTAVELRDWEAEKWPVNDEGSCADDGPVDDEGVA